jgi:hypothetical protein
LDVLKGKRKDYSVKSKNFSEVKMDAQIRSERQDARVWCLEQLIRLEGGLDPRMYECADYATSSGTVKDPNDLYTLWVEWKGKNPTNNPQLSNRL